jgi:diguanylate cyclase (GGDEF)-like protein
VPPPKSLRLYDALARVGRPLSYRGKLLLVTLAGVALPVVALAADAARAPDGWAPFARALAVTLGATVVGGAVATAGIVHVLAPVALAQRALRAYATRQELPKLPTRYRDDAGLLMADVHHAVGRLDEMVRHIAGFDPHSGLANRTLFRERLRGAAARSRRTGRPFAIVALDVDGFERVNELVGPHGGDAVLRVLAQRLTLSVRETDVLARVDGDAFAVLVVDHGSTGAAHMIAHRLLGAVRRPVGVDGREVSVTASVGVAIFPADGEDPDALLANAESAVRAARQSGGNACRFYADALNAGLERRLILEADLPHAIARGELRVAFQPKVRLADNQVTSAEALVRWSHPALGTVSPAEFIPLAEATGQIDAVGDWVLRVACEQLVAWDAAGLPPIGVSVNLSPRQVVRDSTAAAVLATIAAAGLDPRRLEVEVTEGVLLEHERHATQMLTTLRAAGVSVALDDFGTGYSSLAYLHRLPVDAVKIDRQFVEGLPDDVASDAIVAAVIALAKALGLTVIAEGVETDAQRARLAARGCDVAQGYHFGPPLTGAEFALALGAPL